MVLALRRLRGRLRRIAALRIGLKRYAGAYRRPLRLGSNFELPPQLIDPFPHSRQTYARGSRLPESLQHMRWNTLAIVANSQIYMPVTYAQVDVGGLALRMPVDVRQALLQYSE